MAPPADIPKVPGIGLPPPAPTPPSPPQLPLGHSGPGAAPPLPSVDEADIRALDVPHALQILIAEVQAELEAALLEAGRPPTAPLAPSRQGPAAGHSGSFAALSGDASLIAASAPEAARQVLEALLRVLPEATPDDEALAAVLPRLLQAVQGAGSRALGIIESWRDVPAPPREAAQLAVQLTANALSEEPLLAVWLRPDGTGFVPRLEGFRRRRRRLRRPQDPDDPRGRRRDDDDAPR